LIYILKSSFSFFLVYFGTFTLYIQIIQVLSSENFCG
jgi:hypothetical protein